MSTVPTAHLNALGSDTAYAYGPPSAALLERFANPLPKSLNCRSTVRIEAPEFTSLCPKTGQPDFATIVVDYEPDLWCVESKSFKLYLGSFRQHGEFHEACVARIASDLVALLHPKTLQVTGKFTPRGGIPFWPTVVYTAP